MDLAASPGQSVLDGQYQASDLGTLIKIDQRMTRTIYGLAVARVWRRA
jgi:hypothetical protein